MNSVLQDLYNRFHQGNAVTRIIFINVVVFLVINIIKLFTFLFALNPQEIHLIIRWLAVPADINLLIIRPWTLFTYMFLHEGLFHILFNMLMLYWGGIIFLEFLGSRNLTLTYILGGLSGAILFILAYNIFPVFGTILSASLALGASASVLAIMIAAAAYVPNYSVFLFFVGQIRLKYVALIMILIDIVSIEGDNPGGHIAHLGGALYGYVFGRLCHTNNNIINQITSWFTSVKNSWMQNRKKRFTVHAPHRRHVTDEEFLSHKVNDQNRMDEILDKISQSGYNSLSKSEKEFLFRYSNSNQ